MRLRVVLLALAPVLGGCGGCKGDHPYVPYAIDSAAPATQNDDGGAGAAAPEDDFDAGAFAERPAAAAPEGATTWSIDGLELAAPAGRVFALGLVHDFDGDGSKDAFAIVRPPEHPEQPGELVLYHAGTAAPETLGAIDLASDASSVRRDATACAATYRLGQIGKHTVFSEVASGCPKVGSPSRWIAIASGGDRAHALAAGIRFGAVVFDPKGAPKLTLAGDGADADGDGIDDLSLRVTLEGGSPPFDPGPKLSAVARWLDRPAGLSRDPHATESSLAQLAATALARAARSKDAPEIPAYVNQVRSLYRALCPEGGAPRILRKTGTATMACGNSKALEDAGFAEARAWSTMGDPVRVAAAIDRAQRPPATKTASRSKEGEAWLASAAPTVEARSLRFIASVPQMTQGGPAWGPFMFEASGKLLVRTAAGVRRVDPDSGDETDAPEIGPWPSAVRSPDGSTRWIEAYNPCDGFALHATIAPNDAEGDVHDVLLPIAVPLGSRCGPRGEKIANVMPLAWGPRGLEAIVMGEPLLIAPDLSRAHLLAQMLDQPVTPGAPRSPNGKVLVVPTALGIVVRAQQRAWLLHAAELEGSYGAQRGCTATDDATRVACVSKGRGWVAHLEP